MKFDGNNTWHTMSRGRWYKQCHWQGRSLKSCFFGGCRGPLDDNERIIYRVNMNNGHGGSCKSHRASLMSDFLDVMMETGKQFYKRCVLHQRRPVLVCKYSKDRMHTLLFICP